MWISMIGRCRIKTLMEVVTSSGRPSRTFPGRGISGFRTMGNRCGSGTCEWNDSRCPTKARLDHGSIGSVLSVASGGLETPSILSDVAPKWGSTSSLPTLTIQPIPAVGPGPKSTLFGRGVGVEKRLEASEEFVVKRQAASSGRLPRRVSDDVNRV